MQRLAEERPADPYALRAGRRAVVTRGPLQGTQVALVDVLHDVPDPVAKGVVELFGGKVEIVVPVELLRGES